MSREATTDSIALILFRLVDVLNICDVSMQQHIVAMGQN